ncbi:MAG TPA: HAMP domain-containing sensor histidine kinase, partial [Anaeromyxobacter sp.]|nr:HAMP domain-containing sensor histidine kinase [Anaeromyxobacter sp.]
WGGKRSGIRLFSRYVSSNPAAGILAAISAIVLAVGVYLGVATSRQRNAERMADGMRTALALQRLGGALWKAESGHRGFLLTRDERERERFEGADVEVEAELGALSEATLDVRGRVGALAALVRTQLADMRREALARAGQASFPVMWSVDPEPGLLDRIEALRADLERTERATIAGRQRAWSGSTALGDAVFLVANVTLAAVLVVAGLSVRRALGALEARDRERRRTAELQGRLLGIVGHDLRTPLTAIQAGAALLSRQTLPPAEARTAARILSSSRRMARMIHDLLDWTRVREGGGALPLARQSADLGEICRAVVEEARLDPARRAVELARDGDLSGEWDPDRLQQALGNLVSNALRYAPASAPVRVRATGQGARVRVEVENDGPPIPPEVMRSMFEPFRRGEEVEAAAGGLGLGLFIVRSIVEAHGGRVDVASGPGRPTTFSVVLPRGAG